MYGAFAQSFNQTARGTCSAIVHAVSELPRTPTYNPPLTFYTYCHPASSCVWQSSNQNAQRIYITQYYAAAATTQKDYCSRLQNRQKLESNVNTTRFYEYNTVSSTETVSGVMMCDRNLPIFRSSAQLLSTQLFIDNVNRPSNYTSAYFDKGLVIFRPFDCIKINYNCILTARNMQLMQL